MKKLIIISAVLLASCGTAVKPAEVKADSVKADSTQIDSLIKK